eukprot:4176855-Prymnesium_polylepis.1
MKRPPLPARSHRHTCAATFTPASRSMRLRATPIPPFATGSMSRTESPTSHTDDSTHSMLSPPWRTHLPVAALLSANTSALCTPCPPLLARASLRFAAALVDTFYLLLNPMAPRAAP